jgi:hypothetical protein
MHRLIFAIAAALVLLPAAALHRAAAETTAATSVAATTAAPATTGSVQKTAVVCGAKGCKRYWPRHYVGAVLPPPEFPPACPLDYYYECKQSPLGYGQCACWPYRTGWPYSW